MAKKSATKRKSTQDAAPKPISFNPDQVVTGTWLDSLPLGEVGPADFDVPRERAGYAASSEPTHNVGLVVRMTFTQHFLSQTLAGNPASAPKTDHFEMNGVDRYWICNTKLRGIIRSRLSENLHLRACNDAAKSGKPTHCGTCSVCRLFGYLENGRRSRVTFKDLWSEQEYNPVMLVSRSSGSDANPFPQRREMGRIGTHVWGLIDIRFPTRLEIANILSAATQAGHFGIGTATSKFGTYKLDLVGMYGGELPDLVGTLPLVEAMNAGADSPEAAFSAFVDQSRYSPPTLVGDEARNAVAELERLSPISPLYGAPTV